jgi:membrane protein implicated in regulation of membrane protease activity
MALFTENMAEVLLITGLSLLVIEVLVLGFSTFFLFFFGLGLIGASLFFFSGMLDASVSNALIAMSIISGLSAIVLWKPLKKMQNKVDHRPVESDLIGYRFQVQVDVAEKESINHQYSGIAWKISCDQALRAGEEVEVIEVGVGKMKVKPSLD